MSEQWVASKPLIKQQRGNMYLTNRVADLLFILDDRDADKGLAYLNALEQRAALADRLLRRLHRLQHNWLPYDEADCEHCRALVAELTGEGGKEGS